MIKSCKFIDNISHGKQKIAICLIFASFFSFSCWSRRTEADVQAYIERYRLLALEHEMTFHIPACITLAQGLLESDAGQSELASKYNNHFGIKSFNWRGQVACYGDSSRRSCYRVYGTSEDSFLDHAKFLRGSRYDSLYRLDIGDYRAWAEGLRRCGYAEDHAYPQKLISIIERFHIAYLDTIYQYRLQNGYFEHYPDVHPEEMGSFSYVQYYAQPDTNGLQPVEKPAMRIPSNPDLHPATITRHPHHSTSSKTHKKIIHQKATAKDPSSSNKPTPSQSTITTPEPKHAHQPSNSSTSQNTQPTAPQTATPTTPASPPTSAPTPTPAPTPTSTPTPSNPTTVFTAKKGDFTPYVGYPFTEREVYVNNNTLFILAEEGDTYAKIARDVQLPEKKIKKFNDLTGAAKPIPGEVVYIEKKAKSGEQPTYTVQDSETLRYIAQKTGIRLQKLCDFNGGSPDTPLKKGRIIKLK